MNENKGAMILLCFAGIIIISGAFLVAVIFPKDDQGQIGEKAELRPSINIIQTGVSLVTDFYGEEKLMVSYSVNGEVQSILLSAPFDETLPQYQAYLRELGTFAILGINDE